MREGAPSDVHRYLIARGWTQIRGRLYGKQDCGSIVVTEAMLDLLDSLYLEGFKDGSDWKTEQLLIDNDGPVV